MPRLDNFNGYLDVHGLTANHEFLVELPSSLDGESKIFDELALRLHGHHASSRARRDPQP